MTNFIDFTNLIFLYQEYFYPPTPPPMKINDIPLTSVNSIFNQPPASPVTIYPSCRFLPE